MKKNLKQHYLMEYKDVYFTELHVLYVEALIAWKIMDLSYMKNAFFSVEIKLLYRERV